MTHPDAARLAEAHGVVRPEERAVCAGVIGRAGHAEVPARVALLVRLAVEHEARVAHALALVVGHAHVERDLRRRVPALPAIACWLHA